MFPFTIVFRPALWLTQPPYQRISGAVSLGVKRPERETDHSPPSSTEVRNALSVTSTPPIGPHIMVLGLKKKHRGN
jgi:hypothetical protein